MNQNTQIIKIMKHDLIKTTEVLIAGAGPVGLMMASMLSFYNIRCRIIDRKSAPCGYSGAMVIHARTLEIFSQMGLADLVQQQGTRIQALSVFIEGEKKSSFASGAVGDKISPYTSMLLLEQKKTEKLLIDFLSGKGIMVEWETELVDIVQTATHVEAIVLAPGGTRGSITASWLVGADGGQSTVRTLLGIPFPGKTHRLNLSIMEVDASIDLKENEAGFSFSKRATTGFFPLPDGNWRIDAALNRFHSKKRLIEFKDVQQYFGYDTGIKTVVRHPQFFSIFHSHGRVAQVYSLGRCFLAGDASHLFTPVGAQGMNTGLQDAHNLAWKLAMVAGGKVLPEILFTYEDERKPVARSVADASDRFFKLAASPGFFYKSIRRFLLPSFMKLFFKMMEKRKVNEYVFKKISGTGISYGTNLLNVDLPGEKNRPGPTPGDRLPYMKYWNKKEEVHIQDLVDPAAFLLLVFPGHGDAKDVLKLADKFKTVLKVQLIRLSDETKDLYIRLGIKSTGWILVRPDQYIACRSDEVGSEVLALYLKGIFITT
jgi:2-polyprenyl-6-methoxyphenol hydroxylase-like FAD-dependent oxidoreductase